MCYPRAKRDKETKYAPVAVDPLALSMWACAWSALPLHGRRGIVALTAQLAPQRVVDGFGIEPACTAAAMARCWCRWRVEQIAGSASPSRSARKPCCGRDGRVCRRAASGRTQPGWAIHHITVAALEVMEMGAQNGRRACRHNWCQRSRSQSHVCGWRWWRWRRGCYPRRRGVLVF